MVFGRLSTTSLVLLSFVSFEADLLGGMMMVTDEKEMSSKLAIPVTKRCTHGKTS